jgi:hypothetical protein
MRIEIDLATFPATAVLHEPDDFMSFKVTLAQTDHAWVPVQALEQLAGDRASDPEWRRGLEKMLGYAETRGWLVEGAVRAHIDWP